MTRGLSSAQKAYLGPIFWTAIVRDKDWDFYYFWNGDKTKTISGHDYLPYLQINSGFRRTRTLQIDSGEISFDNTDLYMEALASYAGFNGALCVVSVYLFGLDSLIEIFRGRLTEEQVDLAAVTYRVKQEFQPSEINLLSMKYSAMCQWRFGGESCGYGDIYSVPAEHLSQTPATQYSDNYSIGNNSLSMTTDEHKHRFVIIDAGTGRGQARRISGNTATTLTIYQAWTTQVDATSKFRVVSRGIGVPKQLYTAAGSSVFSATHDKSITARTIGCSTLSMVANEHAEGPIADSGVLRIQESIGHPAQLRRIKSNTSDTITIADDEPDITFPIGSHFMVFYYGCPKDIQSACEQRGFTHHFSGAPSLAPDTSRMYV